MNRRYGKAIDPREFKRRDLRNLEARIERKRREAEAVRDRAVVTVDECYVCGAHGGAIVREMFGYEYVECSNCSHVYQTRRLPQSALDEFFAGDAEFATLYTDPEQIEYRLEHITKPKIDYVLDNVDVTDGRWLDVGCGLGDSVYYLRERGWDAVGIEISEDCVRAAADRFGIDLVRRPLREYAEEVPDGSFDVITFFGYLELVSHPMADLRLAHDLLGEGGWLGVGTANNDCVSSLVHRALPDRALRHSIPPIGLQQFSPRSLDEAFDRTGFSNAATWFFGLDFYEFLNHLRLEVDGFAASDLCAFLTDHLNGFQRVIDEAERSDYMLAVARREPR